MAKYYIKERAEAYWGGVFPSIKFNEELKLALTSQLFNKSTFLRGLGTIGVPALFKHIIKLNIRIIRALNGFYLTNRFYRDNDSIYLLTTDVHKAVAVKWGLNPNSFEKCDNLKFRERFFSIVYTLTDFKAHLQIIRYLPEIACADFIQKSFLFLNYISECVVSNLYERQILKIASSKTYKSVVCFELGVSARAAHRSAQVLKIDSEYVQHGFHDITVPQIAATYAKVQNPWDIELLNFWGIKSESISVLRNEFPEVSDKINNSQVALIALEYGTASYDHNEMTTWWNAIVSELVKIGIKVYLRPHPRDQSDWYKSINNAEITTTESRIVDQIRELNIGLFFTIASASILEVAPTGVTCFYRDDVRNRNICCPFDEFAVAISNPSEFAEVLKNGKITKVTKNIQKKKILYSPAGLYLFVGPFMSIAEEVNKKDEIIEQFILLNYTNKRIDEELSAYANRLLRFEKLKIFVSFAANPYDLLVNYKISELKYQNDLLINQKTLPLLNSFAGSSGLSTPEKNFGIISIINIIYVKYFFKPGKTRGRFGIVKFIRQTYRNILLKTKIFKPENVGNPFKFTEVLTLLKLRRWVKRVFRNRTATALYNDFLNKHQISDLVLGSDQGEVDNLILLRLAEKKNLNVSIISICDIEKEKPELSFNHKIARFFEKIPGKTGLYLGALTWRGNIIGTFARNARIFVTTGEMKNKLLMNNPDLESRIERVVMPLAPILKNEVDELKSFINWRPEDRVLTYFTENLGPIYGKQYDRNLLPSLKKCFDGFVDRGYKICIKFHPHEPDDTIKFGNELFKGKGYYTSTTINFLAFLEVSEVSIAHFSRVLIESVLRGKSIISINFNAENRRSFLPDEFRNYFEARSSLELSHKINLFSQGTADHLRQVTLLRNFLTEGVNLSSSDLLL